LSYPKEIEDQKMLFSDIAEIRKLGSKYPFEDFKEKLMLFGQFVGDWEIYDARYMQADGSWTKMEGEVHFGWILGGTAIQDVWIGRKVGSKKIGMIGTTVRFYDPKVDAWHSIWISPMRGLVRKFLGKKVDNKIVLDLENFEKFPERWIFLDITADSFRWISEESHDNGLTWLITEEMKIRRVNLGKKRNNLK
jgi:hypothetical protein